MKENEFDEKFDLMLREFDDSIVELVNGQFRWQEATEFLKKGITVAEELVPETGSGSDKNALVMSLWAHYDEDFDLTRKLDELIEFEKIIGKPLGTVFEIWDRTVIKNVIEHILIPLLVSLLFPKKDKAH